MERLETRGKLLLAFLVMLSMSSCLKESIADAMLKEEKSDKLGDSPAVATLTYTINGNPVTISVNDPDNQSPAGYRLGCSKTFYPGTSNVIYGLDGVGESGEITFRFPTDSLEVGNYAYTGIYGDFFVLSYYNINEFVHATTDSISFNITSYDKGHISGNFSGILTPMVSAGYPDNVYGSRAPLSLQMELLKTFLYFTEDF